jgi:hypothetical protein
LRKLTTGGATDALLVGAALARTRHRPGDLGRLVENMHCYSAPTASLYETVTAPLLGGFFTRVVQELAELAPVASRIRCKSQRA